LRRALLLALLLTSPALWAAPLGLKALVDPSVLAFPPDGQIKLLATTRMAGPGLDYKLINPGQRATIFTIQGPAVIYRIWSTSGVIDETRLILKLDGGRADPLAEPQPRQVRPGRGPDPLRTMDGQAFWSYVPIKVNKSAEFIACDLRKPQPAPAKGSGASSVKENKFYLQVAYSEGAGDASADLTDQARSRLKALLANPLLGTDKPTHPDKPGQGDVTETQMITSPRAPP